MPDGQDFCTACSNPIDDSVVSFTDLADLFCWVLCNWSTTMGLVTKFVTAL